MVAGLSDFRFSQLDNSVTSESQSAGEPSEAFISIDAYARKDGRKYGKAHRTASKATSEDLIGTNLDTESHARPENTTTISELSTEDAKSSSQTPTDVRQRRTSDDDGNNIDPAEDLLNNSLRDKGKGKAKEDHPPEMFLPLLSTPLPTHLSQTPSPVSDYHSAPSTQSSPVKQGYSTAPQTPQHQPYHHHHHRKTRESRASTLRATAAEFTPRGGHPPPLLAPFSPPPFVPIPPISAGNSPPTVLTARVEERTKRARGRCGEIAVEVAMEWLEGRCEGCDGWGEDRREGPIIARSD